MVSRLELEKLVQARASVAARETGFVDRRLAWGQDSIRYQVFVPSSWSPGRRWPVILFLHGAGERGVDGRLPTQVGLGPAIRRGSFPDSALVVFPQAPTGQRWFGRSATIALAALDSTLAEFEGDPQRVYLTGVSMGGQGAWFLAMDHPRRFAALVVICGRLFSTPEGETVSPPFVPGPDRHSSLASRVRGIPIWVFHGTDDRVVGVSESRQMIRALRNAGADPRYTEYPGVDHNAWDRAYAEPELWRWLFGHRRGRR